MTNQVMTRKRLGGPSLKGHRIEVVAVLMVLTMLAVAILAQLDNLNSGPVETSRPGSANLSALPQDGRAYFTEPYWEMGKVADEAGANLSALPQDGRAYFTEPYWEMAEELPEATIGANADQPAYFTERYWRMAAEAEAAEEATIETEFSYYTERYWKMSE